MKINRWFTRELMERFMTQEELEEFQTEYNEAKKFAIADERLKIKKLK